MLSGVIPEIRFDFNFDFVTIMIFISYIVYGFFSGGHKQIRLSINLILPFLIIYYMGHGITTYLYAPLSNTFFFELIAEYLGILKNTIGMVFAYVSTYILLFFGIFILSIFARKYLLNENMRAKLGKKNNYIGAVFSLINGYVLIYFIILPAFSISLVGSDATLTNFVLENPPPFSRIARTAEKAVPVKGLADKANDFQNLLSVDGIEGYYNEAIYEYQQLYVGGEDSFEAQFMDDIYPELTSDAKTIIDTAYFNYFSDTLSRSNYYGVSLVLVQPRTGDNLVYQDMLEAEIAFKTTFSEQKQLVDGHETAIDQYDIDTENYEYQLIYNSYIEELNDYIIAAEVYATSKITALLAGTSFTEVFTETRPTLSREKPENYAVIDITTAPVNPEIDTDENILEAVAYVARYEDKVDISSELSDYGTNFVDHEGLLVWYIDVLSDGQNYDPGSSDISAVIVSFKDNYDDIRSKLNDTELEDKLYLAQMSIRSYDVFTLWIECTTYNIDNVPLDDIPLESSRCPAFDTSLITSYNFTDDALSLVSTLFEGESVSWIITQFKYDYEAGLFEEVFADFEEVNEVLESTKELVDEYDLKYKDIANSIDGNISMLIKIGISVMKYHFDVYDLLKNTPLIAAFFNDAARFCGNTTIISGYDVEICTKSEGETGMFKELTNMRYLVSEVYFKAYFMVDNENERIIYDTETMHEFLAKLNESVEDSVISQEVISAIADQFAFNIVDDSNGITLLEQMYEEGYISIEAMRVLANDEYELFSDDFKAKVRSLIR